MCTTHYDTLFRNINNVYSFTVDCTSIERRCLKREQWRGQTRLRPASSAARHQGQTAATGAMRSDARASQGFMSTSGMENPTFHMILELQLNNLFTST